MCICLGPARSGKTLLLKHLCGEIIDEANSTVPTNGLNIYNVRNADGRFELVVREIGGSMVAIWKHHLDRIYKVMYVIDTSNLCQISAAGILLYSLLVEPKLKRAKFALILTKMDLSYRQMRNEALLMLHFSRLQREVRQEITVIETSGVTGQGIDKLREWIFNPITLANASPR
ncbi:PREDICTED: ADP-ribosylation factor-like protein 16 [Ceratosolen solmsi marchali]|uniref:ADP-ribosylation factor-like protein 16 n=1 Tax=Ceratosolen solmsi marchali TaxID=326594 RepID=A0AAJ6YIJ5_9HYME|nr:PREDICTED: ADP-ribosylation factor-like protein 16 [Ceratosolen solmsi marchali]